MTVTFGAVIDRLKAAVRDAAAEDAEVAEGPEPNRETYAAGDELELTVGPNVPPLSLEERFQWICARLGLDQLERAVLAMCAAPEVEPDVGIVFSSAREEPTHRAATPRLVARMLAGRGVTVADVLVCFDRAARLGTSGAVRLIGEGPLGERSAVIGGQLASHLLGSRLADETAEGRIRRVEPSPLPLGRDEQVARIAALLASRERTLPVAVLGPDALLAVALAAGRGVVALDARALADESACADLALAAALEAKLPAIDRFDELTGDDVRRMLDRAIALPCRPVLCAADRVEALALADLTAHIVELPRPTAAERAATWTAATGHDDVDELAARFRLDVARIGEAAALARAEAGISGTERPSIEQLRSGARAASSGRLGGLARRLAPGPGWEDLVLPARQTIALHAMSSFLRHRDRVVSDWGYERVAGERGLTALFAGESGTGKTLAAQVLASGADLDVYRVDLSGLFSKWVGETEKNLDRLFSDGERANAVLFFDEADVVFGKRTESSDSSDRYANLETAFLLQRIETYDGIVVLATNLRSNMDDAFVRRLDIVIDFPPPDTETRRRLWAALLPDAAPLAGDIDLDFLATRFELSGGGIRNCSLAAALLAAEDGNTIHMRHLIRAVAIEFAKLGRLTVEADFGAFHDLVSNGRR